MKNIFVWVDIPVRDLKRAMAFYDAVIGEPAGLMEFPGMNFVLLPHGANSVSGCLVEHKDGENGPSLGGPLVYVNVEGRMNAALEAAIAHGATVIEPVTQIGEHGFRALVIDSEGNRIALHAPTV